MNIKGWSELGAMEGSDAIIGSVFPNGTVAIYDYMLNSKAPPGTLNFHLLHFNFLSKLAINMLIFVFLYQRNYSFIITGKQHKTKGKSYVVLMHSITTIKN